MGAFSRPIASAVHEKTNILCMDINHTYEALSSPTPPPHLSPAGSSFAAASALALLIPIEGVPLLALSYSAQDLQTRFPHDRVPPCACRVFKQELSRYRAWRRTLFDLFLLETGSFADRDVVAGFERLARLQFGQHVNRFSILRHALPNTMEIRDLTAASALDIDRSLPDHRRQPFRAALSMLDRLQDAPLAAGSRHLLPSEIIGRLPPPSGHLYHAPLPPRLEAAYSDAPALLRAAMPFVYRLSLITGILSPDQDPSLDDLASKCVALWDVDPIDYDFLRPSQVTLKTYIRNIGKHSGVGQTPPARELSAIPQAWSDLRSLMRQHGLKKQVQRTCGVSSQAIKDEVAPAAVTPAWIQKTLEILPRQKRNAFRSGIFVLDDLIKDKKFPSGVLPQETSGLSRERKPTRS